MLDGITGEEIYQRAGSTRFQRGMYVNKRNYDHLTTQQMEDMLMAKVQGGNLAYTTGQGNESPSYANLPKYANDAAAISAGLRYPMPYLTLAGVLTHVSTQ